MADQPPTINPGDLLIRPLPEAGAIPDGWEQFDRPRGTPMMFRVADGSEMWHEELAVYKKIVVDGSG